jgi:hypothetical protein
MFGPRKKRSNKWSTMTALGAGLGITSYALRRNRGNQNKNMIPIPGNNQGNQSE